MDYGKFHYINALTLPLICGLRNLHKTQQVKINIWSGNNIILFEHWTSYPHTMLDARLCFHRISTFSS